MHWPRMCRITSCKLLEWLTLSIIAELSYGWAVRCSHARGLSSFRMMTEYEYEYIPPNPGILPILPSNLPSAFDASITPAGMRGEAVRAAIRSGRCIAWDLGGTPMQQGWIKVEGKGTLDFLNNKLSQTFQSSRTCFKEGCLLNAKGRVVDRIGVAILSSECAYMLTSPGHMGSALFDRLDPLIFPMDRVSLRHCPDDTSTKIFTLASTDIKHAQKATEAFVIPLIKIKTKEWIFPDVNDCAQLELSSGALVTILPTAILPETALSGYTIVLENDVDNLGKALWSNLIGDQSPNGPVEIGALEFETLRIEAGMPLFGNELIGATKNVTGMTPPGPLELHMERMVDMNKGCYLGQEGVASVVKNPRGPPRALYQVIFDFEGNTFESESEGDRGDVENLTKLPKVGSDLFVLGSQNEISVGTITSLAEPSSTGDPNMIGLALVRRADSILKAMRERGLEIDRRLGKEPFSDDPLWNNGVANSASVMIQPPPLDPMDGVEVVVKETFTVGVLRSIPSRRLRLGQNMFSDIGKVYEDAKPSEQEVLINRVQRKWNPEVEAAIDAMFAKEDLNAQVAEQRLRAPSTYQAIEGDNVELNRAIAEAQQAKAEAEAAAAEAQRKIAKMEMLRKRADDALKRRQQKQKASDPSSSQTDDSSYT